MWGQFAISITQSIKISSLVFKSFCFSHGCLVLLESLYTRYTFVRVSFFGTKYCAIAVVVVLLMGLHFVCQSVSKPAIMCVEVRPKAFISLDFVTLYL